MAFQVLVSVVTRHEHITKTNPYINIKILCKQCAGNGPRKRKYDDSTKIAKYKRHKFKWWIGGKGPMNS